MDLIASGPTFYWIIHGDKYNTIYPDNKILHFRYLLEVPKGEYIVKVTHLKCPAVENVKMLNLCVEDVDIEPKTITNNCTPSICSVFPEEAFKGACIENPECSWIELTNDETVKFTLRNENGNLIELRNGDPLVFRLAMTKKSALKGVKTIPFALS